MKIKITIRDGGRGTFSFQCFFFHLFAPPYSPLIALIVTTDKDHFWSHLIWCSYKDKGREFSFSAQPSFLTLSSTALRKFWLEAVTTGTTTKKSITFLQPIGDSETRYVIPFVNSEPVSRLQQLDITMSSWWTQPTAREHFKGCPMMAINLKHS